MEFPVQNSLKVAIHVLLVAVTIAGVIVIRLATGKPWSVILHDPAYADRIKIAALVIAVVGFVVLFIVNNNFFR